MGSICLEWRKKRVIREGSRLARLEDQYSPTQRRGKGRTNKGEDQCSPTQGRGKGRTNKGEDQYSPTQGKGKGRTDKGEDQYSPTQRRGKGRTDKGEDQYSPTQWRGKGRTDKWGGRLESEDNKSKLTSAKQNKAKQSKDVCKYIGSNPAWVKMGRVSLLKPE